VFDVSLTLGPVIFQDFELPDQINVGGQQRLAVHRLIDGQRVIDCLGRDDSDITFHGILSGQNATARARMIDVLRVAGEPLPLTWDAFFYTVILSRFEAEYRSPLWVPYRIACTVIQDDASRPVRPIASLMYSLLTDIGVAANESGDPQLDFTSIQSAIAVPGATIQGSAAYGTAQSEIAGMQSTIDAQTANAELEFRRGTASDSESADDAISSLSTVAQAMQQLSTLTLTQAYLGRAAQNLANAST
jgi:hypothetical protein